MGSFITPVFIGREKETSLLEDCLAAVQSSQGRCVLVSGEAGIGKSRLIAETRNWAAQRGFTTLTGRCFEQDRAFPYAPLVDMLRPFFAQDPGHERLAALSPLVPALVKLLPELAMNISPPEANPLLEPELEKRRLFAALSGLFWQPPGTQPWLLIVEDIHWSDQASLEFLLYFMRRITEQPVLLLLSARRTTEQPGLDELLIAIDREPIAQEIRLGPLTRSQVGTLLKSLLGQPQDPSDEFAEAIFSLTEGNPFFTEEICTALIANGDLYYTGGQWRRKPLAQIDIPDSLQRLVQDRLKRVSSPARQLIDLAAVSGRSFNFKVLQRLTGLNEPEFIALVKELMAAGLVVEESADQFAFRHALTRQTLYSRLLARERQALHGQLALTIAQVYGDSLESQLEALAYHAFEAALWPKALTFAQAAGEKALALYAPHAAVEQFTHAILAAGQLNQAPDSALYRLRGQALDTIGDFDGARQDYEACLSAALATGDRYNAWQASLALGLLWASRDYDRTGDYCRRALELARAMDDPTAIAHSLNRLGNWLMNRGQPFEALEYHHQALDLFEQLGDQAGLAATLDLLAMTSNQCGDAAGTVRYYQQAIPILRRLNDRQTLASSLTMLSNYTLDASQANEAIDLARAIDWRAGEAFAFIYLGSLLAYRGDYGAGVEAAIRGLELAQAIDHRLWQAWAHIILGIISLELMALEDAHRHLQSARTLALETGSSFMLHIALSFLASTCIALGQLDEAEALLPETLPETNFSFDFILLKAAVELRLAGRDPSEAWQLLERLELPERSNMIGGMAYYFAAFLQLRGDTLRQLGRLPQAENELRAALQLLQEQGVRMGAWRLQLSLGRLYQAAAEPEQAQTAFGTARSQIEAVAASLPDKALREGFRCQAVELIPAPYPLTPIQAEKEEFGGLTRRERQVAAVIVRGLSNQEIAEELVISIKTVESHISRILSKLGFSSRAQIAAWAVDKGLARAPQDLDDWGKNQGRAAA